MTQRQIYISAAFVLVSSVVMMLAPFIDGFQAIRPTSHHHRAAAMTTTIVTTTTFTTAPPLPLFGALPKQNPGESDLDYIRRLTSSTQNMASSTALHASSNSHYNNSTDAPKPKGKYQRIEEWDEQRNAKGELTWEEKVQYEGQRYGNQVRQNEILSKNLRSL